MAPRRSNPAEAYDRDYAETAQTFHEPSVTIDDVCLTPFEILTKYTTGEPIPIIPYNKEFGVPSDNYEDLINDTNDKTYEEDD